MAKQPLIVIIHFPWHRIRIRITNRTLSLGRTYALELHMTASSTQHLHCILRTTSAVGRKKQKIKKKNPTATGNRTLSEKCIVFVFVIRAPVPHRIAHTNQLLLLLIVEMPECRTVYAQRTCPAAHSTQSRSTAQV